MNHRAHTEPSGPCRIEKDHLGAVEVPADALFGIQTVRALRVYRVFGVPLGEYREFIQAYARIKRAAAVANREAGKLDVAVSHAIVEAADEVIEGRWYSQFPIDALQGGGGVSANMNLNEVLANRAADLMGLRRGVYDVIHPNDHVNRSQSTNDTYPSALSMAAFEIGQQTVASMRRLSAALRGKADEYRGVERLGRTCLRDALPIGIDKTHEAQAHMIDRCSERLESSLNALSCLPLGATVLGTGVGAPPGFGERVLEQLTAELHRDLEPAPDPFDALQNVDGLVAVAAAAAMLADGMGRIAADLRLLSSGPQAGLNEVDLPAVQAGSSMMPRKTNPAIPELVLQVAMRAQGAAHVVAGAGRSGELELNVMGPVILVSLLPTLAELAKTADVFADHCVRELRWNHDAVTLHLEASRVDAVLAAQEIGFAAV